jgi:hypothetical protein
MPYLLKNVVQPFGFTFLEYLALKDKEELIEKAVELKDLIYIIDIKGNTPLKYALKRKNHMSTKFILNFVSNDDELVSLIDQEELCSVITSGVPNVVSFLEKTVIKIEENVPNTGKMIGNYTKYLKKDPDYEPDEELIDSFCAKVP